MVEETIREIRAAEARADEIVKEAREKSVITAEQTETKVRQIEEKTIAEARERAEELARQTEEKARLKEAEAETLLEKEIRQLKSAAEKKKEEAVDLVISLLV